MKLNLQGAIPSKKSLYLRRRGGGLYLDRKVKAQLDSIQAQMQAQWGGRTPAKHAPMQFRFTVTNINQDRDGILTTLLDLMQKAGVIERDSIAQCNGTIIILPACKGEPGAEIRIEEDRVP